MDDRGYGIEQPPPPSGRGMAERCARPRPEERGRQATLRLERWVTDRVNGWVERVEITARRQSADGAIVVAKALQLRQGDDAPLPSRHPSNPYCGNRLTTVVSGLPQFGHVAENARQTRARGKRFAPKHTPRCGTTAARPAPLPSQAAAGALADQNGQSQKQTAGALAPAA